MIQKYLGYLKYFNQKIKSATYSFYNKLLAIYLFITFNDSTRTECIFVTQYYNTNNLQRQKELEDCLTYNASRQWITQIIIFCEKGVSPPLVNNSTVIVEIERRLTYNDVFHWIIQNQPTDRAVIIFSNSDIFITDDLKNILSSITDSDFLALTRYENFSDRYPFLINNSVPGAVSFTQDTWIFKATSAKELIKWTNSNNMLGILGCESSLLASIMKSGFKISNPCLNIKTVHNHKTNLRSYSVDSRVLGTYAYPKTMTKEQFMVGIRYNPELNEITEIH